MLCAQLTGSSLSYKNPRHRVGVTGRSLDGLPLKKKKKTRPGYNFQEHSLHWKVLILPDCRRQLLPVSPEVWRTWLAGGSLGTGDGSWWEAPPFVTDVHGDGPGHRPAPPFLTQPLCPCSSSCPSNQTQLDSLDSSFSDVQDHQEHVGSRV